MKHHHVDFNFGIHPAAMAVAHLVEHMLENFETSNDWRLETSVWYNGRERGICFSFGTYTGPVLRVVVAEHRSSDSLILLRWQDPRWSINPPTIQSHCKQAYPDDNSRPYMFLDYDKHYEAAKIIVNEFRNFFTKSFSRPLKINHD